jgi:hypothetical protein
MDLGPLIRWSLDPLIWGVEMQKMLKKCKKNAVCISPLGMSLKVYETAWYV